MRFLKFLALVLAVLCLSACGQNAAEPDEGMQRKIQKRCPEIQSQYVQLCEDAEKQMPDSRWEEPVLSHNSLDAIETRLQQAGLNVIHDRGIYDYPSYTGSYTRSGQAIEQYLRDYPSIQMVIDIHRDALGTDDVVYKTMAEEDGVCASQVMLLIGTDESGLEHPNWRQNLAVALYMQNAVNARHPTLMRPIALVQQRYNQHLSPGSMILEVGSNGNTLQEALAAIRLFGQAAAPALAELVE